MTQDTCSLAAASHPLPGTDDGVDQRMVPDLPPMRCADSARMRGEPLHASAVRYSRFLLLEMPGPWGNSALDERHMQADVAVQLARAASATDTHVLLIRRPGRHPSSGPDAGPSAWALADTSTGVERVLWGSWRDPADLLDLDLTAAIPGAASATGPQRLALVCTNGKRDQCCAIRGRPVAAAIAAATDWDTWECSHLGGHRFAATMMLLPTGDMFGWLDHESALQVVDRFGAGQVMLSHYRGRSGELAQVQAALHAAAVRLGDFHRGALRAVEVRHVPAAAPAPGPGSARQEPMQDEADRWEVVVAHRTDDGQEIAYRVLLSGSKLAATLLSCLDDNPKAEIRYETLSFSRVL
jgi:hypothetical protein